MKLECRREDIHFYIKIELPSHSIHQKIALLHKWVNMGYFMIKVGSRKKLYHLRTFGILSNWNSITKITMFSIQDYHHTERERTRRIARCFHARHGWQSPQAYPLEISDLQPLFLTKTTSSSYKMKTKLSLDTTAKKRPAKYKLWCKGAKARVILHKATFLLTRLPNDRKLAALLSEDN